MSIRNKTIIGFLLTSLMIPVISVLYWYFLQQLTVLVQKDLAENIQQISLQTKLDSLSQLVRYYDETLTQSARNYAFTGDKKWKDRYYDDVPKLDSAIKEAIALGNQNDKNYFSSIDAANIALIKMEEASMTLVEQNKKSDAVKILESKEYADQKEIYKKGIVDFVTYRGEELDKALTFSTSLLVSSQKKASDTINYSIFVIIVATILSFLISVLAGFIVSFTTEKNIEKYKVFFESSRDAIMVISPPNWRFADGNTATLKLFGVKAVKEFISLSPADLSPDKQPDGKSSLEKAKEMINIAIEKGNNFFEWTHKKYKGENFYATVLLSKVQTGNSFYILATVRDITKEKQQAIEVVQKTTELERLNKYMVGRELKMIELKKQINGKTDENQDKN